MWPVFILLALFSFRLWLIYPPFIIPRHLPHDDELYTELAQNILSGNWLGPYRFLTLTKVPGYPIWLAMMSWLHISPSIACQLLCLVALLFVYFAFRRAGFSAWVLIPSLSVLVFSPVGFVSDQMRLSRTFLYSSLTLLIFAVGVFTLRVKGRHEFVLTVFGMSVLIAVYSIIREEFVWIFPSLAIFLFALYWNQKQLDTSKALGRVALALVLPVMAVGATNYAVKTLNQSNYGVSIVSDQRDGNFPKAMGALARITVGSPRQFVPIRKAARMIAYEVSPSFSELKDYLEGESSAEWISDGCRDSGVCDDYTAGWIYFAVRKAAEEKDVYQSGASSEAYFAQISNDINAACEKKLIPCGSPHDSLTPLLGPTAVIPWFYSFGSGIKHVIFPHFHEGAEEITKNRDTRKDRLAASKVQALFPSADVWSTTMTTPPQFPKVSGWLWPWIFGAMALISLFYWVNVMVEKRGQIDFQNHRFEVSVIFFCFTGVISRVAFLALVDSTSFRAQGDYLLPGNELAAMLCAVILASVCKSSAMKYRKLISFGR